jgi:glyoxylase-like metal-dependent hydrolase (beta-lactamase superfamily II)
LVIPISDGEARVPPDMLLQGPGWPDGFLDADGLLHVNFGGFLVRTNEHVIVIDTGFGSGTFRERLPVAPEDVDHVVFTHLHWDHVGWSTDGRGGRVLFSRAVHHCHAIDWDYWCGPEPVAETAPGREDFGAIPAPERLAPLAQSIHRHAGERTEIVPGVVLRLAPGHTPGHCIVELDGAVILADAAHNPAQLLSDGWTSSTDEDPELARATRARLADELRDSGTLIAMTHHPGMGHLTGAGWRQAPNIE